MGGKTTIALLSEDPKLVAVLTSALGGEYTVTSAFSSERARRLVSEDPADAAILDVSSRTLYGQEHLSILEEFLARGVSVVVMADEQAREQALALVERGAHFYVHKPPALRELKAAIHKIADSRNLKIQLDAARQHLGASRGLDQLVGNGPHMQYVYRLILKVTNLNASVLITGESGTGKELIARAIHNMGVRSQRPFVAVSCSAIPETLIESELFGHEKGAFTGTAGVREGYFEKAEDGTLFLDEVGELNHQTQVKLLRVLQQREFSRLGSSRTIPLRARVVLATHRDLEHMVAAGKFRQDLFYRINVMNIKAPALREHPEDIPLLAQHCIEKYSELYGKQIDGIEPEALAALQNFAWPGNIRELENVLQRAIIMTESNLIGISELPEAIRELEPFDVGDESELGTFERLIRNYKVKLALEAIQQARGNKTLAAQKLAISRAYLHRLVRLGEPGIDEPETIEMPSRPLRLGNSASA